MESFDWSTVSPAVVAMSLVSLALEWFPGLAAKWEAVESAKKARIIALLVLLVSAGSVLGKCYLWGDVCPENAWETFGALVMTFLISGTVSQGVYSLARREVLAS